MPYISQRLLSTLLVLTLVFHNSNAQVIKRRWSKNEEEPGVLLVQLAVNSNKVEAFRKAGYTNLVQRVKDESDSANKKMVQDFNDNFKFCPVYYYYDTNANLIREKKFDGIILDSALQVVENIPALLATRHFQVVRFGYANPTVNEYDEEDSTKDSKGHYTTGRLEKRLIVMGPDLKRVKFPMPQGSVSAFDTRSARNKGPKYNFSSKRFDIYYIPYAGKLDKDIFIFYNE
ncbi:MAG: hypothetical protein JST82_14970 [Bacteroidetes bacterium]|nr:hypothetical protein [Bacteroidota bacterium]